MPMRSIPVACDRVFSIRAAAVPLMVLGGVAVAAPAGAQSAPSNQTTTRVEAASTIPPTDTVVPTPSVPPVSSVPVAPPADPTGPWLCPLPVGKFTNDWAQPRSGGRRHEGIDMLAPRGTPVIAPFAGVVKKSSSATGGLTFNLKAEDGYTYVGMHLSANVADGPVRAGEVVGYVGATGNAHGTNHLHFEIHLGKAKLNPYATLRRYCG